MPGDQKPLEGTRRAGSWEYTKPAGREGRAWGPPLQRQGRTVGEQCVLSVLRESGPTNRTGAPDSNGVGVRRRQTRPGRRSDIHEGTGVNPLPDTKDHEENV